MVKQQIKKLLSNEVFIKRSRSNRYVFVFHDVSNPDAIHYSTSYSTPVDTFHEQIALIEKNFRIVSLTEIVSDNSLSTKHNYASITFDDGFLSVYEHAAPFLAEKKIPFTLFLNGAAIKYNQNWITNLKLLQNDDDFLKNLLQLSQLDIYPTENAIGRIMEKGLFSSQFERYRIQTPVSLYMNKQQVLEIMSNCDVEIGNHTHDHYVMSRTEPAELYQQIKKTHEILKDLIEHSLDFFAIPFGKREHYDEASITMIREMGYQYIFTTNPNRFKWSDTNQEGFLFPRIGLTSENSQQLLFYINRALFRKFQL